MSVASSLINAADLSKLHSLAVAARLVVEGVQAGAHRSPHRGQSVDFADHRPYVAGDDLRHLDWKVLGRSDRLVLKRYEAETDLGCTVVVDGSASMGYQGERASVSKYRYSAVLAAALSYLVLQQQDRVGLLLFNDTTVVEQRPGRQGQLERICRPLEAHVPVAGTDLTKNLEHLSLPAVRSGLVIIISDFLTDIDSITSAIDRLRAHGHDGALVWVLDPDEEDLGVKTVSRFHGLEDDSELTAEPRSLRQAYQEQVAQHRHQLQTLARSRRMGFIECTTNEAPWMPLNRLLVALHEEKR